MVNLSQGKVELVQGRGEIELTKFKLADSTCLKTWGQIQGKSVLFELAGTSS